jgi:hypothetical protein
MQLSDVRNWLRALFPEAAHLYTGRIDGRQERCIGVYDGNPLPASACLGPVTCAELSVSVLLHWTDNASETEEAAALLYQRISEADRPEIGGREVPLIRLLHDAPVDCTRPDSPAYERVIDMIIIYNL